MLNSPTLQQVRFLPEGLTLFIFNSFLRIHTNIDTY